MIERHPRRGNGPRARRRPAPAALETLEGRQLLAYTPLGFSIPDLAIVDAYTGPVAAYGGPISVTVDVSNLGQSSMPEPLAQFPGARSSADAGPSEIEVYLTRGGHAPFGERVLLGTIEVPALPQNRLAQVTGTFTLPDAPPPGFPATGQTGFITLELDPDRQIRDLDRTNNVLRNAATFQIIPNLPSLQAVALGLPPVMNPGDTIVPQVKVANYGAAPTAAQGPVVVQVVASQDQNFGPGDVILGTFTIDNILPLSQAPTKHFVPGEANLVDPPNFVTLDAMQAVTLPDTGSPYFVGVVIDPLNEIQELPGSPGSQLELVRVVADSGLGLPPAGVIGAPSDLPFPFPPFITPTGTPDPIAPPLPGPGNGDPGEGLRGPLRREPIVWRPIERPQFFRDPRAALPELPRRDLPGDLAARFAAREARLARLGRA
jgi:hypothetical protein